MSSQYQKWRKRSRSSVNVNMLPNKNLMINMKVNSYFTDDEVDDLRCILKIKDVSGVPIILAATILDKIDVIKQLLRSGYHINRQDTPNHTTSLMWAVKLKNIDLTCFLLLNGANPLLKTDSGDNAITIALEHKLWDEKSFITFWKYIKRSSYQINIDETNRSGHSMIHLCVRRDWNNVLKMLLEHKPHIDASNLNGVTPLMLACSKNNCNTVTALIDSGADLLREDNHGRIALCYAISSATKNSSLIQKILDEFTKQSSFFNYLKSRIQIICSEGPVGGPEMFINIVQFAMHYHSEGIDIMLSIKVFQHLFESFQLNAKNQERIKFLIQICIEILFYNEKSMNFTNSKQKQIFAQFNESKITEMVLELGFNTSETYMNLLSFNLVLITRSNDESFIRNHFKKLLPFLQGSIFFQQNLEESRFKILKNRWRRIKKVIENLCPIEELGNNLSPKRHTKTTIPSNMLGAKTKSTKKKKASNVNNKEGLGENPIANSVTKFLVKPGKSSNWREKINFLLFNNKQVTHEEFEGFFRLFRNYMSEMPVCPSGKTIDVMFSYLKELFNLIICKYKQNWQHEKFVRHCSCLNFEAHAPWFFNNHMLEIEKEEKLLIDGLEQSFGKLLISIKDLTEIKLKEGCLFIQNLEGILLRHEIRGIKLMPYICSAENVKIENAYFSNLDNYIETALNSRESEHVLEEIKIAEDVDYDIYNSYQNPDEMYYREISLLSPAVIHKQNLEAQSKTHENSYHLVESIIRLCDNDDCYN